MRKRIGYKVVRLHIDSTHGGRLLSAVIGRNHREIANVCFTGVEVEYKLDEWVGRPKHCGPLSLFTTLRRARCFGRHWAEWDDEIRVYKAIYMPSRAYTLYSPLGKDPRFGRYRSAISGGRPWDTERNPNVVFADAVKLIDQMRSDRG